MKLTNGKIEFSGVLKLTYEEEVSQIILANYAPGTQEAEELMKNLVMLPSENIHITLCHQAVLANVREALQHADFSKFTPPDIELEDVVRVVEEVDGDKRSAFIRVQDKYFESLKGITNAVLAEYGVQPYLYVREFEREHHISIANKTGRPYDSIAFTWRADPKNAHLEWPHNIEPCDAVLDPHLSEAM